MDAKPAGRRLGRQPDSVAERTRRDVAEAAMRVFAERGYEAASLRDIATAAGTTHGLIRHHFGSKDGIWRAAVDHATERLTTVLAPFMARADDPSFDPVEEARGAIRAMIDVHRRHPELPRLLLHEGVGGGAHFDYAMERYAPIGDALVPLFKRLQAAGRLKQFDNRTLFLFLLTAGAAPLALPALSAWVLQKPRLSDSDQAAHIERVLITLLGDS